MPGADMEQASGTAGGPVVGHVVGRVIALWRYPVKSMRGEAREAADVSWHGLAGDRRWGFVRGEMARSGFPWLTIRERAELWQYQPVLVEPADPDASPTIVRTPSGRELDVLDPALAAELGPDVRAMKQDRGVFDTFPLSLISTQAIAAVGAHVGAALDPLRFRPNIVVDAPGGGDFPEEAWVGTELCIGGLTMRVDRRDGRCVMVNVDPATGARDAAVLRAIARERQGRLGVYGTTVQPGRITVGDTVRVGR